MSHLHLLTYDAKPLYYKLYYYHSQQRKIGKFLFPRSGLCDKYVVTNMHPESFVEVVYPLLEKLSLIENGEWCSGTPVTSFMDEDTVKYCEDRLRTQLANLMKEKVCEICHTTNVWENVVHKTKTKGLPICSYCKALLII